MAEWRVHYRHETGDDGSTRIEAFHGAIPVELALESGATARAMVIEREGRLVVARLEVQREGPDGISSRELRAVPLRGAIEAAAKAEAWAGRIEGASFFGPQGAQRLRLGPRGKARWRLGADHFASVAELYLEARSRAPGRENQWVAERLRRRGMRDATPQMATTWVRQARDRYGFLTEAPGRGRAGGEATDKLREWQRLQVAEGRRPRSPRRKRKET